MEAMTTNRTPINRVWRVPITPEMVDLYRSIEALRARCTCPPPDPVEYWVHTECSACRQRWDLQGQLHRLLRCKPWEWPVYKLPIYDELRKAADDRT
jgi:hypothetical protein